MRPGCFRLNECALHAAVMLMLAASAAPAPAQPSPQRALELRPFIGSLQPLDDRDEWFLGGTYTGVQLAAEFPRRIHLVSTIAWTYTDNQFLTKQGTDIWHADLGFETGRRRGVNERWEVHPLVGLGGGVRVYDYRDAAVAAAAYPAAYVSTALELQSERIGLRGDARLFASRFESPVTGGRRTRYDVAISLGIAYHLVRRRVTRPDPAR